MSKLDTFHQKLLTTARVFSLTILMIFWVIGTLFFLSPALGSGLALFVAFVPPVMMVYLYVMRRRADRKEARND